MEFEVRPLQGVNALALGMPREALVAALEELGSPEPFRRTPEGRDALCLFRPSGLALFTYLDADGLLDAVELGRPMEDVGSHADRVLWRGLDLFGVPADELLAVLRQATPVDVEKDGTSFTASELGLGLWRNDRADGFFESVLIAHSTDRASSHR